MMTGGTPNDFRNLHILKLIQSHYMWIPMKMMLVALAMTLHGLVAVGDQLPHGEWGD